jgi:hypothetical protein
MVRFLVSSSLVVSTLATVVTADGVAPRPEPRALPPCPEVAARVNGRPISLAQLRLKGEIGVRTDPAAQGQREDAYQNAMNDLVRRELLFQDAEAHGFSPEPGVLAAAEREIRGAFPDEARWAAFLAAHGFTLDFVRRELRIQETARLYSGCYGEEQVPLATDAEARTFYEAYNPGAGAPSARDLESWRLQVTRNKRNMAVREQLDELFAKARVERYFVRGQCALPADSPR